MKAERRKIREEVMGFLATSSFAGEIHSNRAARWWSDQRRRGLAVYTLSEEIVIHTDTPRIYERSLDLAVEIFLQGSPSEAEIDDACHEVECCVEPWLPSLDLMPLGPDDARELDLNVSKTALTRVEVAYDAQGIELLGTARILWTIVYGTERSEEEPARPAALREVRAAIDLGDDSGDSVAVTVVPES